MTLTPKDYTDAIDAQIEEERKMQKFSETRGDAAMVERYEWVIMGMVESKAAIVKTWRGKQDVL